MPSPIHNPVPKEKDWFDKLPLKLRCLLLLCLTLPVTLGAFWRGWVCLRTGQVDASAGGHSTGFGEYFTASAFAAFLSACLVAVMMGWLKPKPDATQANTSKTPTDRDNRE